MIQRLTNGAREVRRVNDGAFDVTYGTLGVASLSWASNPFQKAFSPASLPLPTGGTLSALVGASDTRLVRLASNGAPANVFGNSGPVVDVKGLETVPVGIAGGRLVLRQRNKKTESAGRVLRWNLDGTVDTTFGTNGQVEIGTPALDNFLGMGVTETGAVLVATYLPDFDGQHWTIRRLTP